MPLKLKERNTSNEHNSLKHQTGRRQTIWLFTRMTEELTDNSSLMVTAGLEPATSGFQVRRPNHSVSLLLRNKNNKKASLVSRLCCTQADYYLRHCKQHCARGKHHFLGDLFAGDPASVVSSQSKRRKIQRELHVISLRHHVNRPL